MQTKPPRPEQTQVPDFQAGSGTLDPERAGGSGMSPCLAFHVTSIQCSRQPPSFPAWLRPRVGDEGLDFRHGDAGVLGERCGRLTCRVGKGSTWGCARTHHSLGVPGWQRCPLGDRCGGSTSSLYLSFVLCVMEKQACSRETFSFPLLTQKESNNSKVFSLHESRV